jgi:hypothetical protein
LLSEGVGVTDGGEFFPGWLVNTYRVENLRELVSVFSLVNVFRVGTENSSFAFFLQSESNVLWKLTADADYNA